MRVRLPQALGQNLYYALGIVIMKGVSFFMLPFITHRLSAADFGRLEVLTSLGALGSILVGFGLLNTMFRFAGVEQDPQARARAVAETFGLNLVTGAAALAAGVLLAAPLAAWIPGGVDPYCVRLALAMVALEGCIAIPLGWLRMTDRAALFFALNTGKALLQTALVIGFLLLGRGLAGVLEAGLIAAAALAAVLIRLQWRTTGVRLRIREPRRLLVYSLPLVGSGVLGFVLTGLDRWILAEAVGPAAMAPYAVAAKFALLAALLLQPFLMWWSPRRFSVLQEVDGRHKAARYAALGSSLALLIAVGVGLTAPLLIAFLLPDEYAQAARYVPWLVLTMAVKDSAELLNLGCYAGKTTHGQLLINLAGSALGLGAMLALVPAWGVWGAIWALLFAQVVRLGLYLLISQRLLPLPYPARRLLGLAGLGVALLACTGAVDAPWAQSLVAVNGVVLMLAAAFMLRLAPTPLRPAAT